MPSHIPSIPRAEPEAVGLSSERLGRIGAAVNSEIAAGRLPGAVIAIARRGKLAYLEAFGHLDRQAQTAMPVDAVFSIASMTKPIVSVAALALYEEGRMMVNEPVSRYLPQLAKLKVATARAHADAEHVGDSVPAQREMTIQDLMRHTAGVTYGNRGDTAFFKRYLSSSSDVAERMSGGEFLRKLAELPLHYEPGSKWDYGFGFDVLGLAIEAVTAQPLAAFLDERIFKPLGMNDSGFVVPPESVHRFAKGLPCDPLTGKPQPMRDSTQPHKFACGGGCGVSTAQDYLRFALMLLNGGALDGTRILGRKTVEYMTADHIGPEIDSSRLRQWPNINGYGFGLGVAVRRSAGGGGAVSSRGEFNWAGATGPYFFVDPSEELAVVFMAHAPGTIRFYFRQWLHALAMQALV
ncbi:MAG TPA: serine hydrolase domain-containing protein [Burkholderiales bacterium]|nr:serine hydrolase domain-containing protein [Burkholderiales bacterium]